MTGLILSLAVLVGAAQPQSDVQTESAAPVSDDEFAGLSARDVVREGNRLLLDGDPDAALGAYDYAGQVLPDAREIAFGRGLANYDLKNFDEARAAFGQVAIAGTDALATDAQYGIGTCDHVEALENTDNPEMAISLLESAMRRYHNVLAENPDHQAALDANMKAASVWRRIKQQQEQQQEQQSDENDKDGEDQEQDGEKKDKQQADQDDDQKKQGSDQEKSDEQEKQEQQSDSSEDQEKEQSQQQAAEQKEEQVSREQAQRQLREMMQALRERKKARPKQVVKMPITPVDKDW